MPGSRGRLALVVSLSFACASDPKVSSPELPQPVSVVAAPTPPVQNPPIFPSDQDLDAVPDEVDQCPREPENYQGVADEDGCPDHPGPGKFDCDILRGLSLPDIEFPPEDPRWDGKGKQGLDELIDLMRDVPAVEVVLVGHGEAHEFDGQELSELRAASIRAYMLEGGVDAGQITIEAQVDGDLPDVGRSARARANDRRVEIRRVSHPDCP